MKCTFKTFVYIGCSLTLGKESKGYKAINGVYSFVFSVWMVYLVQFFVCCEKDYYF